MIADELSYRIREALQLEPTAEQAAAIGAFCRFAVSRNEQTVMLLRGSAGTGKTTLAAAMVRALSTLRQKMVLLAPTGRAAKVFALNAGHAAYTIHRRIYRQKTAADLSAFNLSYNNQQDTLFIVDEASMIANEGYDSMFGSGRLLDDLIRFVYNSRNCRLMLIGDHAQLPPVGEQESPALSADTLRGYGLDVYAADLNEVLRQSQDSGILYNATRIRGGAMTVSLRQFADVRIVPGDELIESLASSYSRAGLDDTIVLTRSNKRANIYNQGIRNQILYREEELCTGDIVMVVKNNYYWTESLSTPEQKSPIAFLANGDRAVVLRVRGAQELYGFRFADVTLRFPDYDDYEMTVTVLLDTLTSEAPSLTREQQEQLFQQVMADYADLPLKQDRIARLKQDRFYNALQLKFAYAVTCHKAQGGQWSEVYIDQGYLTDEMMGDDYQHWLYTAFTRATDRLFLVNWPESQTDR